MSNNLNLCSAKINKNDEFYTEIDDIITEIINHHDYIKYFENKTVLCNCDDPEKSNFYQFFRLFFKKLKLKKMIFTHCNLDGSPSYKLEWYGEKLKGETVNLIKTPLKGNGDFRSEECIEILKEADIVITNPPFSLFREYVAQLMEYDKKFVIIGSMNAITYKEFFPLLKENKVRIGYTNVVNFKTPIGKIMTELKVQTRWFTNLEIEKRTEPLTLTAIYNGNESNYPKYDNYDAINVNKIKDIPKDYFGCMGVPITFLDNYCSEQFEIVKFRKGNDDKDFSINGKCPYTRIIIKRRAQGANK